MSQRNQAYFASGCFWCITPVFQEQVGVSRVISGYSGGDEENPAYQDVKEQKTGHRETVMVEYNPEKISFEALLELFLANVDPFDGEGQFIDRGFSYTLAVYYTNDAQASLAQAAVARLEAAADRPVHVSIEPFKSFWPAEEYHQDYHKKHPAAFQQELIESGRKKTIKLN